MPVRCWVLGAVFTVCLAWAADASGCSSSTCSNEASKCLLRFCDSERGCEQQDVVCNACEHPTRDMLARGYQHPTDVVFMVPHKRTVSPEQASHMVRGLKTILTSICAAPHDRPHSLSSALHTRVAVVGYVAGPVPTSSVLRVDDVDLSIVNHFTTRCGVVEAQLEEWFAGASTLKPTTAQNEGKKARALLAALSAMLHPSSQFNKQGKASGNRLAFRTIADRHFILLSDAVTAAPPAADSEASSTGSLLSSLYDSQDSGWHSDTKAPRKAGELNENELTEINRLVNAVEFTGMKLDRMYAYGLRQHRELADVSALEPSPPYTLPTRVMVSALFPAHNAPFVELWGAPALQVHYADSSHFQAGCTLKNLRAQGLNATVQSLLLASNIRTHLLDSELLAQSTSMRNVHPRRVPPYCDACLQNVECKRGRGCQYPRTQCTIAGHTCSPTSGCVQDDSKDTDFEEQGVRPELMDKVQISADISSGGDVQVPVQEEIEYMPREPELKDPHSMPGASTPRDRVADKVPFLATSPYTTPVTADGDVPARTFKDGSIETTRKFPRKNSWTADNRVVGTIPVLQWDPKRKFTNELIGGGKPVILRGAVTKLWPAFNSSHPNFWSFEYFSKHFTSNMTEVKHSRIPLFFNADPEAKMKNHPGIEQHMTMSYAVSNMSTAEVIDYVQHPDKAPNDEYFYFFGDMTEALRPDVAPAAKMFWTWEDYQRYNQYLWVSSAGVTHHTHMDLDHNFFVQVVGQKRFTLFPPYLSEFMYGYSRLHPLWHKSAVDFDQPDLERFPLYRHVEAYEALLEPGDILYVPPIWWHHVETLTPSVSLSTWSHGTAYAAVFAIYGYHLKVDKMHHPKGRLYAARALIDALISELYCRNDVEPFVRQMVRSRYAAQKDHFGSGLSVAKLCRPPPFEIPTAVHVLEDTKFDIHVLGQHFRAVEPELRQLLLLDFIEEVVATAIGSEHVAAFFRYCFRGQTYTQASDAVDGNMWT